MADIYITYSIRERYWVSKLVATLESEGYSVWWDHAVIPGHNFRHDSQQALTEAKCALVVWSETAATDHWVLVDSEQAKQQGILVSVLVQGYSIPAPYQTLEQTDLEAWQIGDKQDAHFVNLLETVKAHCLPSQPSQDKKERAAVERMERVRAENERKQQEYKWREAQIILRRASV